MSAGRILYFLLATGLLLCLVQIWVPSWYLTGDGPCHLYNSAILKDMAGGGTFYNRFLQLNFKPNPNWMTSLLLMGCTALFKAAVAEKVFLTAYALTMLGGLYLLLHKLSKEVSLWPMVIFLFVFHHTLSKGFYNFSLGTALFPFMIWAWLSCIDKKNIRNSFLFFFFSLLVFFTQLLPFVLGIITCAMLVLSHTISGEQRIVHRPVVFLGKNLLALGILTSPFLLLMSWFTSQEGGLQMSIQPHFYPLRELVAFRYLVCTSSGEQMYASVAGITLLSILIVAIARRLRTRNFHKYDGFVYALVLVALMYVLVPEKFMGRDILITMRLQLYIFMFVSLIAVYSVSPKVKNAAGGVLFLCFIGLFYNRFNCQLHAAAKVQECQAFAALIQPGELVLPLCFAPGGEDEHGHAIADRNYIFNHVTNYLGCNKQLLLLDNYEANAGYFPLLWRFTSNPYAHMSIFEGIEGIPPCADIDRYEQVSGNKVRYIIRIFYKVNKADAGHYSLLHEKIKADYHLIATSNSGALELFEMNTIKG